MGRIGTRGVVGATIAAGCGLLAVAVVETADLPRTTLALLAAAVLVSELFFVSGGGSLEQGFSFSSGVQLAAVMLLGPWAAALVAALGVAVVDSLRRRAARKIAFNASCFALSAAAGGFAFQLAGATPGQLDVRRDAGAISALALAYWAVNSLLVSSVVAASSRTPLWPVLRHGFRPELSAAAELGLGVAAATLALAQPWALVALVPLLVAVYHAHERLASMRRETAQALETFANVVDERDPYTFRHSLRVSEYVRELAEAVGLRADEVERLRWAGRLHDLGKIAVDSSVLRKAGKLDEQEWKTMRRHARLSARLLRRFRFAVQESQAVEYHHERLDGRGYYGVAGDDIPLAAHFLIVADSYDAMTTDRPYRRGLPREQALAAIESGLGTQFHPGIGAAFVALQRGGDPAEAIGAEALASLRRGVRRPWRERVPRGLAGYPALVLVGIASCLLAIAWHESLLAVAAGAAAFVGVAGQATCGRRAERLAGRLGAGVADAVPAGAFAAAVEILAATADVRWAGLVDWREDELEAHVRLERGVVGGPETAALTGLLHAARGELGGNATHLALALSRDSGLTGFLVLAFADEPPAYVRLGLRLAQESLARALAPGRVEARPLEPVEAVA